MDFPNFDDFIAEITSNDNDDELYNPITHLKLDGNGNIKLSCIPDIADAIAQRCEHFSIILLRKYHEWLSEQLSDNHEN